MAKLVVYIIEKNTAFTVDKRHIPTLEPGDITLFYRIPEEEGEEAEVRFHCLGNQDDYSSKKRLHTIFETGLEMEILQYSEIMNASSRLQVWNMVQDSEVIPIINDLMDMYDKIQTDEKADRSWLNQIKADFKARKKYNGVYIDATGNVTELKMISLDEEVPAVGWDAINRPQLLEHIANIIPAIKYEGFNPKVIRNTFLLKYPEIKKAVRNLLFCFSAYSHIGNNVTKLTVRRVDIALSSKLMEAVESMGIKKKERTRTGLTLPRIAIAFMPEYLVFRKFFAGELQNQTESVVPVSYKDICFYGNPTIRSMSSYDVFHKEFSSYIFGKDGDTDQDDPAFLKSYKQWNKVSIQGYSSDVDIHERMRSAIALSGSNKVTAYQYIRSGLEFYKPDQPEVLF